MRPCTLKPKLQVDLEFLPFYFWVCMWCAVFTILVAIFDLCALMKYVTLFTEDLQSFESGVASLSQL